MDPIQNNKEPSELPKSQKKEPSIISIQPAPIPPSTGATQLSTDRVTAQGQIVKKKKYKPKKIELLPIQDLDFAITKQQAFLDMCSAANIPAPFSAQGSETLLRILGSFHSPNVDSLQFFLFFSIMQDFDQIQALLEISPELQSQKARCSQYQQEFSAIASQLILETRNHDPLLKLGDATPWHEKEVIQKLSESLKNLHSAIQNLPNSPYRMDLFGKLAFWIDALRQENYYQFARFYFMEKRDEIEARVRSEENNHLLSTGRKQKTDPQSPINEPVSVVSIDTLAQEIYADYDIEKNQEIPFPLDAIRFTLHYSSICLAWEPTLRKLEFLKKEEYEFLPRLHQDLLAVQQLLSNPRLQEDELDKRISILVSKICEYCKQYDSLLDKSGDELLKLLNSKLHLKDQKSTNQKKEIARALVAQDELRDFLQRTERSLRVCIRDRKPIIVSLRLYQNLRLCTASKIKITKLFALKKTEFPYLKKQIEAVEKTLEILLKELGIPFLEDALLKDNRFSAETTPKHLIEILRSQKPKKPLDFVSIFKELQESWNLAVLKLSEEHPNQELATTAANLYTAWTKTFYPFFFVLSDMNRIRESDYNSEQENPIPLELLELFDVTFTDNEPDIEPDSLEESSPKLEKEPSLLEEENSLLEEQEEEPLIVDLPGPTPAQPIQVFQKVHPITPSNNVEKPIEIARPEVEPQILIQPDNRPKMERLPKNIKKRKLLRRLKGLMDDFSLSSGGRHDRISSDGKLATVLSRSSKQTIPRGTLRALEKEVDDFLSRKS